jgi:hypothetical protein
VKKTCLRLCLGACACRDGKNNLHIDVLHHLMHRKHISMYSMYRNKKIDVLNTSIYFQGYNNLLELDIES